MHLRGSMSALRGPSSSRTSVRPRNAALKAVGKPRKQRRFLLILEEVELADDVVAFLAGVDQLAQARLVAPQPAAEPIASGYIPATNSA